MRFLYLIVLSCNLCHAKNITLDTLARNDYNKLKIKFFNYYDNEKVSESKLIAKYYLQKAKREKNDKEIVEGYILNHYDEDFVTSLNYIDSIDLFAKKLKGNIYPARIYLLKGNVYYKFDHLKQALDYYILGLKKSREQKNEKLIIYSNINIAYLNSYIGKNVEAAKVFRHYLYNNVNSSISDLNQMRVSLAYCYLQINKLDSAQVLINQGIASTSSNKYYYSQYQYLLGNYNIKQKKYSTAIKNLSFAKSYFSSIHDSNLMYVLYSSGKAYDGLRNQDKAVQNFTALDSLVQKTDNTFPELKEVYTYLSNYFKGKNNKEKQLYYMERFLKVNKKLDDQFRYLSTEVTRQYDNPKLLKEKEDLEQEIKRRKWLIYSIACIMFLFLIISIFLYYKSKKTEKKYRKTAHKLVYIMKQRNKALDNGQEIKESSSEFKNVKLEEDELLVKNTPEDFAQAILRELENFENKEMFLKKELTLSNLSKILNTNTAYLSEVINIYKGKNLTAYLNDLRINYVLDKLLTEKKFRSYKLNAIAEELGYNNVQAFSSAFKKKTGTTPAAYIKEIEDNLKTQQPS